MLTTKLFFSALFFGSQEKLFSGSHNVVHIWDATGSFGLRGTIDHSLGSVYSLAVTKHFIIVGKLFVFTVLFQVHVSYICRITDNPITFLFSKGQVIRATFSFNLWRNIVALSNLPGNKFQSCKLQQYVAQSRPEFYILQQIFQLVAWQVEYTVVIRATTLFNLQCNCVARQVERNCCPYYVALSYFFFPLHGWLQTRFLWVPK